MFSKLKAFVQTQNDRARMRPCLGLDPSNLGVHTVRGVESEGRMEDAQEARARAAAVAEGPKPPSIQK